MDALATMLRDAEPRIAALEPAAQREAIKLIVYDAGRREPFIEAQKDGTPGVSLAWFNALYQVLLGQDRGPRFDTFVALYGVPGTIALIEAALARRQDAAATG